MAFRSVVCLSFVLLFTSCGLDSLQNSAGKIQSDVSTATKNTIETTTNAVKKVEKKIQQGKDVLDAVETTKQKINAFQSE